MTVSGGTALVIVIAVLVVAAALPIIGIGLVIAVVRRAARIAGSRSPVMYFIVPLAGLWLLMLGQSALSSEGASAKAQAVLFIVIGLLIILFCVFQERRAADSMLSTRRELDLDVDRRTAEERQHAADLHRAAGVNASDSHKVIECPSCHCQCILPMGHAIVCANCGNPVSFAAQATGTATAIVRGGIAHDDELLQDGTGVTERDLHTLRQVHAVDGHAVWGDEAKVTFRCANCGTPADGVANRPPVCARCGRQLTVSDIVADVYGATAQVDSAQAAAAAAPGAAVPVICPTCGTRGTGRLNRAYTCATCGHVIGAQELERHVPPTAPMPAARPPMPVPLPVRQDAHPDENTDGRGQSDGIETKGASR